MIRQTMKHTDSQTRRQTDKEPDRQTQTDKEPDRQTDSCAQSRVRMEPKVTQFVTKVFFFKRFE